MSGVTVCTLWEGDYHKGLAALANSLYANGYRGKVWAGYRGALPAWAGEASSDLAVHVYQATAGLEVCFVKLETPQHLAHNKAAFCKQVLQELHPGATGIYYFDPDIVVLGPWSFFEQWLEYGIAGCEDSHHPLNPSHPIAHGWVEFAERQGLQCHRPADFFLNSGLVGLKREHLGFLDEWHLLMDRVREETNCGEVLRYGSRATLFNMLDQDTFTLACWTTVSPISWIGVDGMAFDRGGWLVDHATGYKKPWRRRPLRDLLSYGVVPDQSLRAYWNAVSSPIPLEPESAVQSMQREIKLAAFLGRFYRKPDSVY